jgi:hypothetical protein
MLCKLWRNKEAELVNMNYHEVYSAHTRLIQNSRKHYVHSNNTDLITAIQDVEEHEFDDLNIQHNETDTENPELDYDPNELQIMIFCGNWRTEGKF